MKIIDLLNKIANGEDLPKKFKYNDKIWRLASNRTYFIGSDYGYDFWLEHGEDKFENEDITLNDEIEILDDEEKGLPEKLPYYSLEKIQKAKNEDEWREERISLLEKRVEDLHIKINDLIDYLEKQRKGE